MRDGLLEPEAAGPRAEQVDVVHRDHRGAAGADPRGGGHEQPPPGLDGLRHPARCGRRRWAHRQGGAPRRRPPGRREPMLPPARRRSPARSGRSRTPPRAAPDPVWSRKSRATSAWVVTATLIDDQSGSRPAGRRGRVRPPRPRWRDPSRRPGRRTPRSVGAATPAGSAPPTPGSATGPAPGARRTPPHASARPASCRTPAAGTSTTRSCTANDVIRSASAAA